jgi:hypothetical protein
MSNTELENAKANDVQPAPKECRTERRSLGVAAKRRQSSTRPHVKSQDAVRSPTQRRAAQASTKQDLVIQMLGRRSGVSIDELVAKTGWQPHSVRGFLSGVVRKRLGLPLASEAGKDGVRRYHIAPITSSKA